MDKELLLEKIKELAPDGSITCLEARELAENLGIPASQVGKVCSEAPIKITACELGCF
ncbi:MAG: hypothetical protein GX133_00330 [Syntrophomonadaceae bacterium]|nr:hypothetical protein [Syntrophomonadaceae bacterium]